MQEEDRDAALAIWNEAYAAFTAIAGRLPWQVIAQALADRDTAARAQEREECAKVAHAHWLATEDDAGIALDIANAIRSPQSRHAKWRQQMSSEIAAQAIVGDIDDRWAKTFKVGKLRRDIIAALDEARAKGWAAVIAEIEALPFTVHGGHKESIVEALRSRTHQDT